MMDQVTFDDYLHEAQASFDEAANPRLAEILRSALRHLYAFVDETKLTREEWAAGIDFLTEVGQKCDGSRQEFILLSDTLGVSMLVEMLNQMSSTTSTEPTVLGPFYRPGAPRLAMGSSIARDESEGEQLIFSGTVRNSRGNPLEHARLDVWQTAPNGLYDVQDPSQPPFNYRGVFETGSDGAFEIHTSRPVDYEIPTDGPVGQMLRSTGRHAWRPAHTHFKVSCAGYKTLVTHAFDADSPHLRRDAVFGVREGLIIDMNGGRADFSVVLDPLTP
ncbi:MAG TPA: dioxygenase [Acidimicrobiales bacterium]|nr:dioxygenase [Acidimicrobiales bacterium]